tara:strand:- start:1882 stop:2562 length:681 start_codon:yes stop_codon:yes gene_type:complete
MSELTDQQIFDRLGAIKGLPTCSQWALGFADSIRDQISKGRTLSLPQKAACRKIFKENSEEAQAQLANWASEYKMHHKQEANQLATYYKHQSGGYFGDLVKTILVDEVPPRGKYLKMRNNKFAKKVLAEIQRKPRFSTDDHIIPNSKFLDGYSFKHPMMSSRNGQSYVTGEEKTNFKSRGGIIIGTDDKICSAAKGAKRYLVLPFGSAETYWVEERFLKKKSKVKK